MAQQIDLPNITLTRLIGPRLQPLLEITLGNWSQQRFDEAEAEQIVRTILKLFPDIEQRLQAEGIGDA